MGPPPPGAFPGPLWEPLALWDGTTVLALYDVTFKVIPGQLEEEKSMNFLRPRATQVCHSGVPLRCATRCHSVPGRDWQTGEKRELVTGAGTGFQRSLKGTSGREYPRT